jgi:hypothetical protein
MHIRHCSSHRKKHKYFFNNNSAERVSMTNGEYQKKLHRGSTPSREGTVGFLLNSGSSGANGSSEAWKNLPFFPVSSSQSKKKKHEQPEQTS